MEEARGQLQVQEQAFANHSNAEEIQVKTENSSALKSIQTQQEEER